MCDCNFLCKIVCALVLAVAFLVNTVSGWFGGEDLIPTQHCYLGCTCYETTLEEETTVPSTEEHTTIPTTESTTRPTVETTTKPVTEPSSTPVTSKPFTKPTTEPTTESTTYEDISNPAVTYPTTEPSTEPITTEPISTVPVTRPTTTKPPETDPPPYVTEAEQYSLEVFGGSGDDIYRGIASTSDGGYVVCGTTDSTDGDFAQAYTNNKWKKPYGFVARYSKTGSLRWIKAFASTSDSIILEDIAVLSDGTMAVVGYTKATDYAANSESKGTYDAIILRLTSTGYLKTSKSFGGKNSDMFTCVTATENGFAVGGTTYSTTGDFEGLPGTSAIIMNFDANNNVVWKKYLHGNAASTIGGIAHDDEGNIFATCLTSSTTDDFSVYEKLIGGYTDTVVLKYDKTGGYKWGFEISSSGRDEFAAITPDGKGGCVVAGNYELIPSNFPDGTLEGIHHCGNIDALVFRINPNGTQRWVKTLSGFEDDFITDVVKTNGGFAISGYTASANREFAVTGNEGGYDGFVSFINTNGATASTISQAGTKNDMATCLTYTTEGEIVALGKAQSGDVDFAELNTYSNAVYIGYIGKFKIKTS